MNTPTTDINTVDAEIEAANSCETPDSLPIEDTSILKISSLLQNLRQQMNLIYRSYSAIENRVSGYCTNDASAYRSSLSAVKKLVSVNSDGTKTLSTLLPAALAKFLQAAEETNLSRTLAPCEALADRDRIDSLVKPISSYISEAKDIISKCSATPSLDNPAQALQSAFQPLKSVLDEFKSEIAEINSTLSAYRKAFQEARSLIQTAHETISISRDTIDLASSKSSNIASRITELKSLFRSLQSSVNELAFMDSAIRDLIGEPFPLDTTAFFDNASINSALTDEGFAVALTSIAQKREPVVRLMDYAVLARRLQEEINNKEDKMEKLLDRMHKDGGTAESDTARTLRKKMQSAVDFLKQRQSKVLSIMFKGRREILRKIIKSTMMVDKCFPRITRLCPLASEAIKNNIDASLRVLNELNERHVSAAYTLNDISK